MARFRTKPREVEIHSVTELGAYLSIHQTGAYWVAKTVVDTFFEPVPDEPPAPVSIQKRFAVSGYAEAATHCAHKVMVVAAVSRHEAIGFALEKLQEVYPDTQYRNYSVLVTEITETSGSQS